jgi:hypothetical protein
MTRRTVARVVALAFVYALAACSWSLVGESFAYMTAAGGPPSDGVRLPNGSRVYWWRSPGCELGATVDAAEIVTAAEFVGADCSKMRARFGVEP